MRLLDNLSAALKGIRALGTGFKRWGEGPGAHPLPQAQGLGGSRQGTMGGGSCCLSSKCGLGLPRGRARKESVGPTPRPGGVWDSLSPAHENQHLPAEVLRVLLKSQQ